MAESFEERLLAKLPEEQQKAIADGIVTIAQLPSERFPAVARVLSRTLSSPGLMIEAGASELGIPDEKGTNVVLALAVLGAAAREHNTLDVLVRRGLVKDGDAPKIGELFAYLHEQESAIRASGFEQNLADALLPAIDDIDVVVDLRFRFQGNEIVGQAPVALIHLTTDVKGHELWFQMSRPKIVNLIRILEKTLRRLDKVDESRRQSD